jgi:hypothetical protein
MYCFSCEVRTEFIYVEESIIIIIIIICNRGNKTTSFAGPKVRALPKWTSFPLHALRYSALALSTVCALMTEHNDQ